MIDRTHSTGAEQAFQSAIAAAGLTPPHPIIGDGGIHRFSTNGNASDRSGFYMLHLDAVPAGSFGDWRTGLKSNWCGRSETAMTQTEREAHRIRVQAMAAQRDTAKVQCHDAAALEAAKRFDAAAICTQHTYLMLKGVQGHGIRQHGRNVLVPMRDTAGKLHSLQTITPDGEKRFLSGGRVEGCHHTINKPSCHLTGKAAKKLIVCEGYATGASIFEATGEAVAVAFNAGNLLAVALAWRAAHTELQIVIAADDDHRTDGNPGMSKARAAATSVGGLLAVPLFGPDRTDKATDFNDLHQTAGLSAVKASIDAVAALKAEDAADSVSSKPTDGWPELQALSARIDAENYPLDALPSVVRLAVEEVARFVKAPIPLIASSALAALSLAIQAHTDVERAEKLTGPTGLFLLSIADSGERKSTCDGFFTQAIKDYQTREQESAKALIKTHAADHDVWEATCSGLKDKIKALAKEGKDSVEQSDRLHGLRNSEPLAPRVPRLIYGDATPEALTYSLAKVWPSGGVISSEAGSVFGGHGMGSESVMRNLATLNQLWDGATLPVERRASESYTVRRARLTMALQAQEATIRAFFTNTKGLARGIGFLSRFLVSWPQSTQGTRAFTEAPSNWPALAAFNSRLTAILNRKVPIDDEGVLSPGLLKMAPPAKEAWVKFHDAIERKLSSGGELRDVRDVASKTADNAARLAALFHVFEGNTGPIEVGAMESAARVTAWHLSEAKRFLSELAMPAEIANPARLETWMLDYCKRENTDSVPTREVQRFGPGGLRDKATLQEAIKELAELGRARQVQDGKKRLIQLNPALLSGVA